MKKNNKKEIKKKVINFAQKEYKNFGIVPSAREIDKKLNISFWSYFPKGMNELYKLCKFKFSPQQNRGRSKEKRREELENKILNYIRSKVKQSFYPTHDEINEKFKTNIPVSIKELYKQAGVQYKRDPNPFLRYAKEKKLTEIAEKLFSKSGYKIKTISIGPSKPNGADIVIEDKKRQLIPVEIKAYQKFGKIGQTKNSPYIRNEFLQLKRYIKNLSAPHGYLITSTDRKTFKSLPSNIKILFGKDLKKLLLQFKMYKELKDLDWIRDSSISYGKEEIYKKIQERILKYVSSKIKQGKYVSNDEIMDKFKINIESYFPGGMREIYKKFNIDVELVPNYRMSRKFDKEKFKERIIHFVKEENKKGHFPTYKEIQKKFSCLLGLYFPRGIREIAKLAGIKYNRKFATKTLEEKELIRNKIINYIKKQRQKEYSPKWREIEQKFKINILNYFKNMKEIYRASCREKEAALQRFMKSR